jgi:uncharacterized repeat protein (TIGR03803 family)
MLRLACLFSGLYLVSVFTVSASATQFRTLYSFGHPPDYVGYPSGLLLENGNFYGTTSTNADGDASIFEFDPINRKLTPLYPFTYPVYSEFYPCGLAFAKGTFYGVTPYGGKDAAGTIFEFEPMARKFTILHSFTGGSDGENPFGGAMIVKGVIYGTTNKGGNLTYGTLFQFDLATNKLRTLHPFFGGSDGATPSDVSSVIFARGFLFGTTIGKYGSVFEFNLATGKLTTLHTFSNGPDGAGPSGGLLFYRGLL